MPGGTGGPVGGAGAYPPVSTGGDGGGYPPVSMGSDGGGYLSGSGSGPAHAGVSTTGGGGGQGGAPLTGGADGGLSWPPADGGAAFPPSADAYLPLGGGSIGEVAATADSGGPSPHIPAGLPFPAPGTDGPPPG